jgi:hypothetical protein
VDLLGLGLVQDLQRRPAYRQRPPFRAPFGVEIVYVFPGGGQLKRKLFSRKVLREDQEGSCGVSFPNGNEF